MIYISHKLNEVFQISDRITVLRDGKTVGANPTGEWTEARVIARMVGREVGNIFPGAGPPAGQSSAEVVLDVENISVKDPVVRGKMLVDNVSFSVRRGEVLGIAGLMGAGRSDLLMAIFGAHDGAVSGAVKVNGSTVDLKSPAAAIKQGIGFVTEDRKRFGLLLDQTVLNNMMLAGLRNISGQFVTNVDAEAAAGEKAMKELRVKARIHHDYRRNLVGR